MAAHPELIAQNSQFVKELHKLAPNINSAIGYAASNVHLLVVAEGFVVIDAAETTPVAEKALEQADCGKF